MSTKYKFINELYKDTLQDISSSKENWKSFLTTASMNYKYSFSEQVLIYAQKPDAKACASIETWNNSLKRWVNKGAKGIALLTEKNGYSGLTYVFDVSDTNSRYGKNIELWSLDKKYEEDVVESLGNKFGDLVSTEDIYNAVLSASSNIIEDNIDEYIDDFIINKEHTLLNDLDKNEIKAVMYELLLYSTAYTTLNRSGLNADEFIRVDNFKNIELFNSPNLLLILGTMNNELSRLELNEIYSTLKNLRLNEIRTFDNVKTKEYNIDNERSGNDDRLQNGRGLSNSEPRDTQNNRENSREVFDDEIKSFETKQESGISGITDDRRVGETLSNDSRTSNSEVRQNDRNTYNEEQYNRRNEVERSVELDTRNEQYQESSRGTNNSGINTNLSLFPTEEEQKEMVEAKDNASTFFVSKEDIDKCLLKGSNVAKCKYRIYKNLTTNLSTKDCIKFMKDEYGWGGGTLNMEKNLSHQHDAKGITITKYGSDEFYFMNWTTVIKEIKELINNDRWFNSLEKEDYQNWLLNKEIPSININEDKIYQYYLGAKVYIGTEEFEILEYNDNFVKLYDIKYPLFNKEFSREEFDIKVKENPTNDHLIKNEDIIDFINIDDEEIKLLYKILNKYNINDIKLEKNNSDIIATDSDNTWYNNELYDFVFNEVIVDSDLINNDDLEKLNEYRNKYSKSIKEKEYSNEELIGLEVTIENRTFEIESINGNEVELRDIGYHMEVGYPIFTTTSLENVLNNLREDNFEIYSIKDNKKDNVILPTISDNNRLKYKKLIKDIDDDFENNILSKIDYDEYVKEYRKRLDKLNKQLLKINNNIELDNNYKIEKFKRHMEEIKSFQNLEKLNRKCIEELIKKIIIYENGNIIIKFRYQNEYLSLLDFKK